MLIESEDALLRGRPLRHRFQPFQRSHLLGTDLPQAFDERGLGQAGLVELPGNDHSRGRHLLVAPEPFRVSILVAPQFLIRTSPDVEPQAHARFSPAPDAKADDLPIRLVVYWTALRLRFRGDVIFARLEPSLWIFRAHRFLLELLRGGRRVTTSAISRRCSVLYAYGFVRALVPLLGGGLGVPACGNSRLYGIRQAPDIDRGLVHLFNANDSHIQLLC